MMEFEGQDEAKAPKYQGIVEFIRSTPRWWKE
jgi:hypothetical protein